MSNKYKIDQKEIEKEPAFLEQETATIINNLKTKEKGPGMMK